MLAIIREGLDRNVEFGGNKLDADVTNDQSEGEPSEIAGGMSNGEMVTLQLYLDRGKFKSRVEGLGVETKSVTGLVNWEN